MSTRRTGARARATHGNVIELPRRDADPRALALERYRVYALADATHRPDDGLQLLATAPDAQGLGLALITLREEGQITHNTRVGVKDDVLRKWIVNPFAKGDK